MKKFVILALSSIAVIHAHAVTVTFDGLSNGDISFSYDADADGQADAVFTSVPGAGFFVAGPGPNQLYINEPGLTNFNVPGPEVRIDFPNGAITSVGYSFALDQRCSSVGPINAGLTGALNVYDSNNNLLGSSQAEAVCTSTPTPPSGYVEAQVSLNFVGRASYALIDFGETSASAFILDNFSGTFGSTETAAPVVQSIPTLSEWSMFSLSALVALAALVTLRRRC